MQQINSNYIVGLVDGEGSFTVYVKNPSSVRLKTERRVRIEPKFYIKLVAQDKKILYDLKKYFDCGSVYFQKDTRANHQNCYRYEVYNREDIEKIIIPFFKKHSLQFASKKRDFKLFCQIFEMILKNEHLNKTGLIKMFRLKQKMH